MNRETREFSRMAAAALVAAATAPTVMPLPTLSTPAIAEDTMMGMVVDANAEQAAQRARTLAEQQRRVAIVPANPPFSKMRSQRRLAGNGHHDGGRHGDRRPRLRRGRFW